MANINEPVLGLFTAEPTVISEDGMQSAIRKQSVDALEVHATHLIGDDCFDTEHHGGDLRVIHHYTRKNYERLRVQFPQVADKFVGGSYGENLLTEQLDDAAVCMGDIFRLGEVVLELTTPRGPCRTIDVSYGCDGILKHLCATGYVGWFYRVREAGVVTRADRLELIERPNPQLVVHNVMLHALRRAGPVDRALLEAAQATGLLDKTMTKWIARTLAAT